MWRFDVGAVSKSREEFVKYAANGNARVAFEKWLELFSDPEQTVDGICARTRSERWHVRRIYHKFFAQVFESTGRVQPGEYPPSLSRRASSRKSLPSPRAYKAIYDGLRRRQREVKPVTLPAGSCYGPPTVAKVGRRVCGFHKVAGKCKGYSGLRITKVSLAVERFIFVWQKVGKLSRVFVIPSKVLANAMHNADVKSFYIPIALKPCHHYGRKSEVDFAKYLDRWDLLDTARSKKRVG